jgi:hypothetical protein
VTDAFQWAQTCSPAERERMILLLLEREADDLRRRFNDAPSRRVALLSAARALDVVAARVGTLLTDARRAREVG